MVNNVSFDRNQPSDLSPLPVPTPAAAPARGPSTPGGNTALTGQLGRAPAPPDSGGPGVSLADRRVAPSPPPSPAPAPDSSRTQQDLNTQSQEELRKKQVETEQQEEEQTNQQIRANTATTARTLALKTSERMGMNFKNGADIQSKLI